jgi:hypothetical protein
MEKNLRADWGGKDCRLLGPSLECALTCCSAVRREHKVWPLEVRDKKAWSKFTGENHEDTNHDHDPQVS